jgi:hypothetical protein
MTLKRKTVFIAATAVAVLAGAFGFSWLLEARDQRFESTIHKLVAAVAIPEKTEPSAAFDTVRRFIHAHSRHREDAEFRSMRGDANQMAERLLAHATKESSEPVHLECSRR